MGPGPVYTGTIAIFRRGTEDEVARGTGGSVDVAQATERAWHGSTLYPRHCRRTAPTGLVFQA